MILILDTSSWCNHSWHCVSVRATCWAMLHGNRVQCKIVLFEASLCQLGPWMIAKFILYLFQSCMFQCLC